MGRPLVLLVAASLGVAVGCLVDLAPSQTCGDGYVDTLAGEDCEPTRPDSLDGRCPAGEVPGPDACDPSTCTFVAAACTLCGNGLLDPGEACDPKDMSPLTCPFGGTARCRSDCTVDGSGCARGCGDGVVDADEECDFGPTKDRTDKSIPIEVDCAELRGPTGRRYTSGKSTECVECKWDRTACGYCGNHKVESLAVVQAEGLETLPEVCDRSVDGLPIADPEALNQHCQPLCKAGGLAVACAFSCADACDAFDDPEDDPADNGCCVVSGESCPYDADGLMPGHPPCCGAPPDVQDRDVLCIKRFIGENLSLHVCR